MKILRQGVCLALVAAGLGAVPGLAATAAAPAASPAAAGESLVTRMRDDASGATTIARNPATDRVGFVRARSGDLYPSVDAGTGRTAAAKATAYLDEYAGAFGARAAELEQTEVRRNDAGWTVEFAQAYRGVPVFGGQLQAHLDEQGDLTSVNGFAVPALDLSITPRLAKADAAQRAVTLVRAEPSGGRAVEAGASGLKAASTELSVYRLGSTRGVDGPAVLAWVVEVTNGTTVRETVILDARTGKPVNRWSMMAHALERELYEEAYAPANQVWAEGDAFPADLDEDQANEVLGTGEAYWMFMNTFGRDSYDGEGSPMITVNNDPSIQCPNANWNGTTTNYCSGVTSDDTVAHEWGHAYTEYTSGLIYQWQSGAMNEAYSDIWGETVDMLNDRMNADDQAPREEGGCSILSPSRLSVEITAPADVAGPCAAVAAANAPAVPTSPITPQVVVGVDDATSGSTTDGCSAFTNAAAIAGQWVYVDENFGPTGCSYTSQGQRAEDAGALGIIVGSDPAYAPYDMPSATFDIYAMQVDGESGERFKTAGTSTIEASATAPQDPSGRWLSGEEDPAFGGAIRDMWNPTCYGDPGKVSDEEYHCETSDSGGVHTNSGVVNHTYALLVDGSTSNGVTVPAIGLDKAANIFWRTQTEYLTPISDFTDLADGLAASCADLVGQEINAVTLGSGPTGGGPATPATADPITAADCAAVDAAAAATELRTEPVQCNFGPLLDPNTPSLCGDDFTTETTFAEDFEDGLTGWTQDEELVFPGTSGVPWEASTSAPGEHAGGVAFGPDPTSGSCLGDAADISGRNGLASPAVTYPTGTAPRLSFDHYVATEVGWDGGNVKVSVDGGAFALVPPSAYVFNAPGGALQSAEAGNTNPMAGEPAFTGTDGGEPTGSWGTSIVDLSQIEGAAPGDELVFRFDLGRDGCNGVDGWYVDNVTVTVCVEKPDLIRSSTKARAVPGEIRPGGRFVALVKVDAKKGRKTPTGRVEILFRDEVLASGKLNRYGIATILVRDTDDLRRGSNRLVAHYLGSDTLEDSKDSFTVRVRRR